MIFAVFDVSLSRTWRSGIIRPVSESESERETGRTRASEI